jgi:hypothetical protein
MIDPFYIAQGDRLPYYRVVVRDLSGVTSLSDVALITFRMKNLSTASIAVSSPAVITDALNGEAEYRWAAADTTTVGTYAASFEFLTVAGLVYSLPRNTIAKIIVEDKYATG